MLLTAVEQLTDVVAQPLGDVVARLDLAGGPGDRPVLFLDPRANAADLREVLPEVIAAIFMGPVGAPSARQSPKLTAVS